MDKPSHQATDHCLRLQSVLDALPNPGHRRRWQQRHLLLPTLPPKTSSRCRRRSWRSTGLKTSCRLPARCLMRSNKVRSAGGFVQEYSVTVGTPRAGGERTVDLQTSVLPDDPTSVVITLQRRSMAQKLDLQLTHQGAARSVSGMAAMLAHEIKNPLSGIRGAAQLMEPSLGPEDRATRQADLRGNRPHPRSRRPDGSVFRRATAGPEAGQHSCRAWARTPAHCGVDAERRPSFAKSMIRRCRRCLGNQDQLVQVFLNLAKNAAEALEVSAGRRRDRLLDGFPAGHEACRSPVPTSAFRCRLRYASRTTGRALLTTCGPTSSRRS